MIGVVIALLSVVLWALWLPFRHGRIRLVADALIGSMLLGTTLATALDGSVRSSAAVAASLAGEAASLYERLQSGESNPVRYLHALFDALPAGLWQCAQLTSR